MSKFKCWVPEQGQTEDDGVLVSSMVLWSPSDAAECYAENHAWCSADPFNSITVRVMDVVSGRVFDVDVGVHPAPVFTAGEYRDVEKP